MTKNAALTQEIKCLEAVNAELSQQLTLKLEKSLSESNHGFRTNAEDICDKLTLKQEVRFVVVYFYICNTSSSIKYS